MLIAVVPVTTFAACQAVIMKYAPLVDGFEFRWDFTEDYSAEMITRIRALTQKTVIFTLRTSAQGGKFNLGEVDYVAILQRLAQACPDFLDLDYQLPADWFYSFAKNYPRVQIILSMHIFTNQAVNWREEYQKCLDLPHAVFKLAKECKSGLAALQFLQSCQTYAFNGPRSIIAMGQHASFARVLGPCLGNFFDYACLDETGAMAPGQLSVNELLSVYRYRVLSPTTAIYGLIGDPIEGSIGHHFHNHAFARLKKNAVYIKIALQTHELEEGLNLILAMKVKGLSVTMPLKQALSKLLGSSLIAINTLKNSDHEWQAYNVDGIGALEAYEQYAKSLGKQGILIIGNGGAALAIQAAFVQNEYNVVILARRPKRSGELAELKSQQLHSFTGIINTLPAEAYIAPHDAWIQSIFDSLVPGTNVMDIVYQQKTLFQLEAERQVCHLIPGIAMYYAQARHQLKLWFDIIGSGN